MAKWSDKQREVLADLAEAIEDGAVFGFDRALGFEDGQWFLDRDGEVETLKHNVVQALWDRGAVRPGEALEGMRTRWELTELGLDVALDNDHAIAGVDRG
jgi:hypothetical protein